jgi:RNA polymerase sigma factor (sigma-70 family)
MTETHQLLAEYAEQGSEDAFRELVQRYVNLVYSSALRLVRGDRHLAEDVTQTVFVRLSRHIRQLPPNVMLGGWLHRDTCHVASNLLRGERRRRAREEQVALMESLPDHTQANLAEVGPVLDEAINLLDDQDRAAILLRFFEQMDFRRVGAALGSSEDAARQRVTRALDKLNGLLTRRGLTLSATALAAGLAGEAVTAAPAGLGLSVATSVLAGSATTALSSTSVTLLTMTKFKALLLGTALLGGGAAVPLWLQHRDQLRSGEENRALRAQVDQLSADNERLSNQVNQASAKPPPAVDQERELLRLRAEVGSLRRQVAEAAKVRDKAAKTSQPDTAPPASDEREEIKEQLKQAGLAKMNYTKGWVMAFMVYSQQHQGQFPNSFEQAEPFLGNEFKTEHGLAPDQSRPGTPKYGLTPDHFEILYQGALEALASPQNIIVVREKDPWQGLDGGWVRTYGFADGHTEIHKAMDGNFEPWETQHVVAAPPAQPGQ